MKKITLFIAVALSILGTMLVAGMFLIHSSKHYNEEGRYFDPKEMTVYQEQTGFVYGLLTVIGLLLTTLMIILLKKTKS